MMTGDYTVEVKLVFLKQKEPAECSKEANVDKAGCAEPVSDTCAQPASSECGESSCSRKDESPCANLCEAGPDEDLGMITRNPFFNYLREYRRCHKNESAKEIAIGGASKWNCMSESGKAKYIVQAFQTPKKYYRTRKNSLDTPVSPVDSASSIDLMDSAESTESMDVEDE